MATNKHTQAMATPTEKLAIARAPWSLVSSFVAIVLSSVVI